VERVGLRLQLRKQQAEAGDIVLLYGDESEALTHPYLARVWAKAGADLRVPAPGQAKKVAMLGSLDHVTRQLIVHTSRTKRSSDFVAHLEQLDRRYGPKPGQPTRRVMLVEDNGPSSPSQRWLPVRIGSPSSGCLKFAPELHDIEAVWHDLKAHDLAHQTFADADALDRARGPVIQIPARLGGLLRRFRSRWCDDGRTPLGAYIIRALKGLTMGWKPGQSGNPGGPKGWAEVNALARQHTAAAIDALLKALADRRTRVQAAQVLLDRGWCKLCRRWRFTNWPRLKATHSERRLTDYRSWNWNSLSSCMRKWVSGWKLSSRRPRIRTSSH
jgi:hypothetical protein